jgi:hypothetical protein
MLISCSVDDIIASASGDGDNNNASSLIRWSIHASPAAAASGTDTDTRATVIPSLPTGMTNNDSIVSVYDPSW